MKTIQRTSRALRTNGKFLLPLAASLLLLGATASSQAGDVFSTDFSKGTFDSLGWVAKGGWTIIDPGSAKPDLAKNPGPVAKFPANGTSAGTLIKKFDALNNPASLKLTFDGGFGWGGPNHAQGLAVMLLDAKDNGYIFNIARAKANWAVQWGKVVKLGYNDPLNWAPAEVDTTQTSVMDGGGLRTFTITRDATGKWTFNGEGWTGGPVTFTDTTTTSFTQVVLYGTPNSDDQLWNKVKLEVEPAK